MRSTCLAIVLIRSRNELSIQSLVPIPVTLNDLERRDFTVFGNGSYFALFYRIRVRCRRKTIVRLISVSKSTFDRL